MTDWIIAGLLIAGSLFILVAALGIIRLRDVYMRMHAITKASSLGITLYLIAMIFAKPELRTAFFSFMIILFIVFTAPIATHLLARVAHAKGIKLSHGSVMDELADDLDKSRDNVADEGETSGEDK